MRAPELSFTRARALRGDLSLPEVRDLGSSPAERGRGIMCSMVEGAYALPTGDGRGAAESTSNGGGDKS
ncbi:hypothetical protein SAMN04488498_102251 [Mesorhizobium albiziae]|uniref:Uncharacterized protein n=1 Tax=Neomesorhizobium albiziae TaxID=335020 RepID=A0A1I3WL58_9HYPH|nr:hypothetical protein SAMN04488498_102251 [Mesorhizobium albiziae]